MNLRIANILAAASALMVFAIACGGGVGAEVPPTSPASTGSSGAGFATEARPTSTPWPHFGPPPVTADSITPVPSITPTVQSAPNPPGHSSGSFEQNDPLLPSANELAGISALIGATPVAVQTPDPTLIDQSGGFDPVLPYSYPVPLDWELSIGKDTVTVARIDGNARVYVRERVADRSVVTSVAGLPAAYSPTPFTDWSNRSLSDLSRTGEDSYRLEYAGSRLGKPYIAVVDWHLWGGLLVEVVIEAEAAVWASDTNVHNSARFIAAVFAPDPELSLHDENDVREKLGDRFKQNASNIFTAPVNGSFSDELTCHQVLTELMADPVYVGSGEWQVFAVSGQGAQVWRLFEPGLEILTAEHNTSTC